MQFSVICSVLERKCLMRARRFVCRHVVCVDHSAYQVWCSRERMCQSGRGGFARFYELVDPQLTAVYAESPDDRRERHDSIETLAAHWETLQLNVTLWARLLGMSDQELVEQGIVSFIFYTIELWHMIGVRAPASPHDPARIRRKTTSTTRRQSVRGCHDLGVPCLHVCPKWLTLLCLRSRGKR